MLENLKGIHSSADKPRFHNHWVRFATCFLLAIAGYLLFQIGDGFPPRVWRFLFDKLPQLQSLWATQGFGILLPFGGLLLLSLALLILWCGVVYGIIHSVVHLWPTSHHQEHFQTNLDEGTLTLEQDGFQTNLNESASTMQQPSQPQTRLQSTDMMNSASPQQDSSVESLPYTQKLSEQQPSPKLPPRQFQRPFPYPVGTGLAQPVPEQIRQDWSADEGWLLEGPRDVSEDRTRPTHTVWNEEEDEQEATLRLVIGIGLDPGLVRKDRPNEDSLFAIQGIRSTTRGGPVPAGLFVIADGMGGHANGSDASRLAVREISNIIVPALLRDEGDSIPNEQDEQEFLLDLLKEGVHRANHAINERNRTTPNMMGTTVTTGLVVNTTAYIINVGDSRTYLYRATDGLVQITRDHSIVAHLVEEGEIKPDEIYTHPLRNQIYRCLGEHETVEMDTFVVPLQPDDILLLCSDGLWEMVYDQKMEEIITTSSRQPAQISNLLVEAALTEGGVDNISVVVVGLAKTTDS
jgi:serine/threonine protein phosphatase PrpC